MEYWIDKLGFWGYMRQFPLNPITIVGGIVILGIIVLFANAAIRKRKAARFLAANAGAAVMAFHKRQIGNNAYADNIRLVSLNGETPHWFFLKPAIPAIYLQPGDNHLQLYAEWARQGGGIIKNHTANVVNLTLRADAERIYSLEYYIPESQYIFQPCTDPHLQDAHQPT